MRKTVKKYGKIDFLFREKIAPCSQEFSIVNWKKGRSLTRAFATYFYRSTGAPGLARFCPVLPGFASQADPIPSLLLTRRYSGRQSLGKAQTPSNYYYYYYYYYY